MDAHAWLTEHATPRIDHASFACLPGCGFCCTYPPEVTQAELTGIEQTTDVPSVGIDPAGTMRLPLQGGCGGCTLLEDRRCTAYESRPMHCLLFPFHVYLGRRVEIYADRVCPGLDPDEATPNVDEVDPAAIDDALAQAARGVPVERLEHHRTTALEVHDAFERLARDRGAWTPLDALLPDTVADARVTERAWDSALEPLASEHPDALPTMVLPVEGFPWRAWRLDGDRVVRLSFGEEGRMEPIGSVPLPDEPAQAPEAAWPVLERWASLACFAGVVYDRVDAADYGIGVEEALSHVLDELLAELALRALLLEAEPVAADEATLAASLEPAFFDRPSIGAWL